MRKYRCGFTLIEASLFLAVSALLFFFVTIGVQTSIKQQRYNDSVQSFAEFLRTVYAGVLNVQNINGENGRSEQAIYGKLITFGERYDLSGNSNDENLIFVYDVVGGVNELNPNGNALDQLIFLEANVVKRELSGSGNEAIKISGAAESYKPRWSAQIEPACSALSCNYSPFSGMVLVVRHPSSGLVNTYFSSAVFEVNELIKNSSISRINEFNGLLSNFKIGQVDFCVNPEAGSENGLRRDVRIVENARNTSGVEIIADNDGSNVCRRK